MEPKISVLTTTCRTDPFLFQQMAIGLKTQAFDFEWIIVDDHRDENTGLIDQLVNGVFPLIHIYPDNVVPYFAKASALNDGLRYCNGEIVFFMCDYSVPQLGCLQRHWDVQTKYKGVMLSGRRTKIEITYEALIKQMKEGNNNIPQWSDYTMQLFERDKHFSWTPLGDDVFEVNRAGIENWMNGRNDSCPLAPLLECNGFDQIFDGRWGGEDADMAHRLMTYGVRFLIDKGSNTVEIPHESGGGKEQLRSERQQQMLSMIITQRVMRGITKANDQHMIAEARDLKEEWQQAHA